MKSKTRDWITVSGISSGKQFESGVIHLSDHSQSDSYKPFGDRFLFCSLDHELAAFNKYPHSAVVFRNITQRGSLKNAGFESDPQAR